MAAIERLICGWVPVLLWGGAIFYLSSQPASAFPRLWFPQQDKIAHIIEYCILAILIYRAVFWGEYRQISPARLRDAVKVILGVCAIFAASDEIHQVFIPTRTASVNDWLSDVLGTCIAVAFCVYFSRQKSLRR